MSPINVTVVRSPGDHRQAVVTDDKLSNLPGRVGKGTVKAAQLADEISRSSGALVSRNLTGKSKSL